MEPANPLLPALRPDTPALLRRTGSLLGAVQGIQQEASAAYWFGLLTSGSLSTVQQQWATGKCVELVKNDIEIALKQLHQKASFDECKELDPDGQSKYWGVNDDDETGAWCWAFEDYIFYEDAKIEFAALLENYQKLASLQMFPQAKAQVMLDAAEAVRSLVPYQQWAVYISCAVTHHKRIETLQKKLRHTTYWPEEDLKALSEIIDNFPTEPEAYLARAKRWETAKKYTEALNDLNAYISFGPADASAFKLRGRVRNFLGDVPGMVEDAITAERLGAVLEKWWLDPPAEAPF